MPSAPEDAFPLQLMHGAVVSEAAGIVLDGLPPGAFATSDASAEHGALIIGLRSQDGPTSLLDIRIGQVSRPAIGSYPIWAICTRSRRLRGHG